MSPAIEVLVIDDSATIRKLVELSMRGSSLRPHFAASGGEGVERARALAPAAILLDCVLPDLSGVEVCHRLAADPRTRSIPVLLITARAESARHEFRSFPSVVDFIGKPFTGPDLLARVARAVGAPAHAAPGVSGPPGPARPASSAASPAARPPRFTRAQQERAARIVYGRLRDGFALIPSHMSQLGASPPGPFFARRLLTPAVIEGLLDELANLCAEIAAAPAEVASAGERPAVDPASVVDRVGGFSDRVRDARLSATARRLLTVVDGRHPLAALGRRLGLDDHTVCAVAHELIAAGLLQRQGQAVPPRPVIILEPDVQGFQQPLASLLETRGEPRALVAVDDLDQVVTATQRVHPCLVVVNATSAAGGVSDAARLLRADRALADVALVAVLDTHDRSSADALYSAGFDAVLSKPILFGELERFIAPSAAP